tara:strand:- start:552 stop:746 length:195 start_codon:yes stop_codon:yes gene_type:complete
MSGIVFTPDFVVVEDEDMLVCIYPDKCPKEDRPCLWCMEVHEDTPDSEIEKALEAVRSSNLTNN